MSQPRSLRQSLEDEADGALLFADGFDDAILGVASGWFPATGGGAYQGEAVVYDLAKCIRILVRQGMSPEDAEEYLEFNTLGAYAGEGTPLFLRRPAT